MKNAIGLTSLGLSLLLGSCAPGTSEVGGTFDEVTIPSDFMFATQSAVAVTLEGDVDRSATLVEILSPDNELLYRGPLGAASSLRLPLATWIDSLTVKVEAPGLRKQLVVEVADARAVIKL
jgi:hypothetical protein